MNFFQITARTTTECFRFGAIAESSVQAALDAADLFGDMPCGITVTPAGVQ